MKHWPALGFTVYVALAAVGDSNEQAKNAVNRIEGVFRIFIVFTHIPD